MLTEQKKVQPPPSLPPPPPVISCLFIIHELAAVSAEVNQILIVNHQRPWIDFKNALGGVRRK